MNKNLNTDSAMTSALTMVSSTCAIGQAGTSIAKRRVVKSCHGMLGGPIRGIVGVIIQRKEAKA